MALYQVQAQVVTIRPTGHCSVGTPTFWVQAQNAEAATSVAKLVLAAGRRNDDPHQVELHGTVYNEDRGDYLAFRYTEMVRR